MKQIFSRVVPFDENTLMTIMYGDPQSDNSQSLDAIILKCDSTNHEFIGDALNDYIIENESKLDRLL